MYRIEKKNKWLVQLHLIKLVELYLLGYGVDKLMFKGF